MRLIDVTPEVAQVELTIKELILVNNALNEICYGPHPISVAAFHSRTGSYKAEAEDLLHAIGQVIREAPSL